MLQPNHERVRTSHPAATARATPDPAVRSTEDVVRNHLERFGAGDLEGILADYAPGAVLFTPDGPLRDGAIRRLFEAMLAEFGQPGTTFDLKRLEVEGDHAFIVWAAETADHAYELGTDTFFVRAGRIEVQSFAGKLRPKR